MEGPAPTAFGRITASNHRHFGFDFTIKLNGPTTARLLSEEIHDVGMLLFLISVPYVIYGSPTDAQDLGQFSVPSAFV
jgi:hypothetical protein